MCGIAGILYFSPTIAEASTVARMTTAMTHRGPDADGFFTEGNIGLGHRRLSIIDLSTSANQPFFDPSERYVVVFNGEIYNYQELKALMPEYTFRTTSDTEALLAAYIKWGEGCLEYFKGMFAFAVWDKQKKELFIARDRLGVKPLYYFANDHFLVFASETRAILASGVVPRKINPKALIEYFSFQSIGYPYSLIEGINQLEAGAWMKIQDSKIAKKVYWRVTDTGRYKDFDFGDKGQVHKKIHSLMSQSVAGRMVSDVPLGAFLSGGIDSSAIVGLMAENSDKPINTFNVSFNETAFDESKYAELVGKKFNTHHTNIILTPEVLLTELENALDALDSPSGDGVNTYVVSKAIKQAGITVALSGIGGDELFAGYPIFGQFLKMQSRQGIYEDTSWIRSIAGSLIDLSKRSTRNDRVKQILTAPSTGIEYMYPVFREILTPDIIGQITNLEFHDIFTTRLAFELYKHKDALRKLPLLSQVSAAEYLGYTQHTLLKDTDQMSMAVSLEVREPFFDYELVEFVMAVPDDLKRPTYPKSLLVESLSPLLPQEVVHRKKQGFTFPWETWMKNELKAFCAYHIRGLANRNFINTRALMDYWNRFLMDDPKVRWAEVWLFVVLGYWLEKNDIDA